MSCMSVSGWSLLEYSTVLRERGLSWQDVYWLVWGRTHGARCTSCAGYFVYGTPSEE